MVKRKTPAASSREILTSLSRRLAGCLGEEFYGQEKNVTYLLELVTRTVEKGESNSLIRRNVTAGIFLTRMETLLS